MHEELYINNRQDKFLSVYAKMSVRFCNIINSISGSFYGEMQEYTKRVIAKLALQTDGQIGSNRMLSLVWSTCR